MNAPPSETSSSPAAHRENIRQQLSELIEHLEADTGRVDDPRFRGLLTKSAGVVKGLRTLFERYEGAGKLAKRGAKPQSPGAKTNETRALAPAPAVAPTGAKAERAKNKDGASQPGGKKDAPTKGNAVASAKASDRHGAAKAKSTGNGGASAEGGKSNPKNGTPAQGAPRDDIAKAKAASGAATKPQDPEALKAKIDLQRKEARAPKTPSQRAPKQMPPQSGKPIWDLPHSS